MLIIAHSHILFCDNKEFEVLHLPKFTRGRNRGSFRACCQLCFTPTQIYTGTKLFSGFFLTVGFVLHLPNFTRGRTTKNKINSI